MCQILARLPYPLLLLAPAIHVPLAASYARQCRNNGGVSSPSRSSRRPREGRREVKRQSYTCSSATAETTIRDPDQASWPHSSAGSQSQRNTGLNSRGGTI